MLKFQNAAIEANRATMEARAAAQEAAGRTSGGCFAPGNRAHTNETADVTSASANALFSSFASVQPQQKQQQQDRGACASLLGPFGPPHGPPMGPKGDELAHPTDAQQLQQQSSHQQEHALAAQQQQQSSHQQQQSSHQQQQQQKFQYLQSVQQLVAEFGRCRAARRSRK